MTALPIQNQAAFVRQLRESDRTHVQFERETCERAEALMAENIRSFADHNRIHTGWILEYLTDTIRDKLSFHPQQP